ncbi:hypothetical protein [Nocardioides houyundeii]|uniref:hypothetical protein n=1 Tax=Nocardioides houyundeii TaxID=2045452 RepID=UPI000DF1263D|nr:hypothetical protein [Nocardioides houyundeii]
MKAEQDTPLERPTFDVKAPAGGWLHPWPNVSELARELPTHQWTLIGGLMTQLHAIHRGVDAVRPTNDVDIVLHIETTRGMPNATANALEKIGYTIKENIDPRNNVAHRFARGATHIDVVVADHPAPSVEERMRSRDMVKIEGGTQALRRTANYLLEIVPGERVTISVPRPFGATILKAAAYKTDTRDRQRHLQDAAVLLACIEDPEAEREGFIGSDRSRLLTLERELVDQHVAWQLMPEGDARRGQAVLRLLVAPD